jgi:diadenosine tetraphosphate (Ap4A) HIT family hydrolase
MVSRPACPFCAPDPERILSTDELAFAYRDRHPVSPGHALIVPRRHVGSWFDLSGDEHAAVLRLLEATHRQLVAAHHPDGFNLGINDGAAAGQTVPHVHLHVIPRYRGDSPDPRGGVRWVIGEKAGYWSPGK